MSRVIYRYAVQHGVNKMTLPFSSDFLSFKFKDGAFNVWVISTEGDTLTTEQEVVLLMTGESTDRDLGAFIGTAIADDDWFTLHAFCKLIKVNY